MAGVCNGLLKTGTLLNPLEDPVEAEGLGRNPSTCFGFITLWNLAKGLLSPRGVKPAVKAGSPDGSRGGLACNPSLPNA